MATIIDRIYFFMNGAVLGSADSGSIEWVGDPIIVDTLVEDFQGSYPVPKHCMVSISQFEPATGSNFDPVSPWLATETVTVKAQLGGSGKVFEADGNINSPSIKSSPSDPTKWDFKVACKAVPFE